MNADGLKKQLETREFLVGFREAKRAIESGTAGIVIVAADAEKKFRAEVETLCRLHKISHHVAFSMRELGDLCGIDVGAAVVTLL